MEDVISWQETLIKEHRKTEVVRHEYQLKMEPVSWQSRHDLKVGALTETEFVLAFGRFGIKNAEKIWTEAQESDTDKKERVS